MDTGIILVICAALFVLIIVVFLSGFSIKYQKKITSFQVEKEKMESSFKQELLQSKLEIQEQTFNHISQEIHDNVGQILSLAKVQVNIMNETRNLDMVDEVKESLSKAMTDLRDIARSLSSERIRSMNIVDAVRMETERINKSGIIQATVSCSGEEKKMNEQKKQILFRMIQECLQNVMKHAQASETRLHFTYLPGILDVSVQDNGKGFDINGTINNNSGLGLQNIKTRAALIGAALTIESELNGGCLVTIKIPYE